MLLCSCRAVACCMKHQGVPVLYASISLAYFEAEKGFFVSMLRLRKKYAMLIKKERIRTQQVLFFQDLEKVICSRVPRPEVVGEGRSVKPLVYRQWKLRHVTLVKSVNTTAFIQTTCCRTFHKMWNVLSENLKFGSVMRGRG